MPADASTDDLRCRRTRRVVSAGLDGEACAAELLTAAPHLARCMPCRQFAAQIVAIAFELRSWPDGHIEPHA